MIILPSTVTVRVPKEWLSDMSETSDRAKGVGDLLDEREADADNKEADGLRDEVRGLHARIRSMEYSSTLEKEAFKREMAGAFDEINMLNREKNNLKRQLEEIMKPPMLVGEIMELIDDNEVIVRNGTGQYFITTCSENVERGGLAIGARVGLDRNNLVVMRTLTGGKDPIIMGSELLERPTVTYADIGGLEECIREVRETVELPLTHPERFRRLGIDPPKGILLEGPPGTGKTLIAKAAANSAKCTFIRLVGSELVQKFIGEGGRLVRELFQLAREKRPCIIFIDELDAIGAKRLGMDTTGDREVQRTLMQLLAEMDGFHALENIGIISATNRKDIIDEALLRPGRFDRIISIPLPDERGREQILEIHTREMPLAKGVDLGALAAGTDGYSGADLKSLCTEAGMFALRSNHKKLGIEDFESALRKINERMEEESYGSPGDMFH